MMLSQSEHEAINAREYPGTRELCCACCEPTGRAGRGDDSIYRTLIADCCLSHDGLSGAAHAGDEVGPLCPRCNAQMVEMGFVEAE